MAEEFIPVHEKDLGALASGRTAAKVRGIDDQGQSVNLTPAQIATMAGIDYSLLTEQIVPGEFAMNLFQEKKQVYTRAFVLSTEVKANEVPRISFRQNIGASLIVSQNLNAFVKATASPIYRSSRSTVNVVVEPESGVLNIGLTGIPANEAVAGSVIWIVGNITYTKI